MINPARAASKDLKARGQKTFMTKINVITAQMDRVVTEVRIRVCVYVRVCVCMCVCVRVCVYMYYSHRFALFH